MEVREKEGEKRELSLHVSRNGTIFVFSSSEDGSTLGGDGRRYSIETTHHLLLDQMNGRK